MHPMRVNLFFKAMVLAAWAAGASRAADYQLFVEFFDQDGKLIEGPVEVRGYRGWVDALGFVLRWAATLDPTTGLPAGGAQPSLLEITVPVGPHTPRLAAIHVSEAPLRKVVLHFATLSILGVLGDFYTITFEDVHITSRSLRLPDRTDPDESTMDDAETLGLVYTGLEQGGYRVEQQRYLPGDTNGDLVVDISDPILLLGYLFLGSILRCPLSGDVNGDSTLDISDAVTELNFLFAGGRPPPSPFPECGIQPADVPIPCELSACDVDK